MRRLILSVAWCMVAWSPAPSQTPSYSVLGGVTTIDARIRLGWSEGLTAITGTTEGEARRLLESRFTQELRQFGLATAMNSPNYLTCAINVAPVDGFPKLIRYEKDISFWQRVPGQRLGRPSLVLAWEVGSKGGGGVINFGHLLNVIASSCAKQFGVAWRLANPTQ